MRMMRRRMREHATSIPDYMFLGSLLCIVIFGFVMLASASSDLAELRFHDSYHYLKRQFINGLGLGLPGFLFGYLIPYRRLQKAAKFLLLAAIGCTLLVFTPLGLTIKGATRWIDLGIFSFQPGELLKFAFPLYVASWLANNPKRSASFTEGFLPLLVLMGFVAFILLLQPATTTAAIILASAVIIYFISGARIRFFPLLVACGALAFAVLILMAPYRMERVKTFFNPEKSDALGEGYHARQAETAIGSGGLWGVGYGKSATKLRYLPEPIGDSMFAVVGEELGFVGSSALLFFFFAYIYRGFMIAKESSDSFGRLLAAGFTSIIGVQMFINVGAISGAFPLTGVPLPFMSFGGTSLAVFLTMAGVIMNISKYRK